MITLAHPALARIWSEAEPGRAAQGYAPAGPADRTSAAWANATLGNALHLPVLEISLGANEIRFDCECTIAWSGAPHVVKLGKVTIEPRQAVRVLAGQRLHIAPGPWGNRLALAVVGGWQGRCDEGLQAAATEPRTIDLPNHKSLHNWLPKRSHLRVTEGPEAPIDWRPDSSYRVSMHANNQGLRLVGPGPELETFDIASGPVIDGTIQATPDGLIALLRERQTVGGYPRVAQIIPSDVDLAAQLRPGDSIRFDFIDLNEAHEITQVYQASFKALEEALR